MAVDGIYFDADEAQFACTFIESLTLTKTKSGRPERFRLLPPHRKLVVNLFGWKRPDGTRLYRRAYFSVARKNAKTQIAAAIGLLCLLDPNEPEPEVYIAAKDRDQAGFCYKAAMGMVLADPDLDDKRGGLLHVTKSVKEIFNHANGGLLKALSSEGDSKHGSNPSCVIIDEFHVWGSPEQELYDALTTGSMARRQPLEIIITTAGVDEYTLCGKEYDHACKVRDGLIEDPAYFPLIYEIPKDADFSDESLWPLANPTLGDIVLIDKLREIYAKGLTDPSEMTKFRRLNCNQWVNSANTWIPRTRWDACTWRGSSAARAMAG